LPRKRPFLQAQPLTFFPNESIFPTRATMEKTEKTNRAESAPQPLMRTSSRAACRDDSHPQIATYRPPAVAPQAIS
jgi:hypothetical protein